MKLWILPSYVLFIVSTISFNKYTNNLNMEIQYAYTILYVEDVPKSTEFYEKSLGFKKRMLTPENDYGEIMSGATTIAFANFELGRSNIKDGYVESDINKKPFGIELAFTTNNVEETMKKAIANGAVLIENAVTKPWGQEVGYLKDVNGFILEICTPITSD